MKSKKRLAGQILGVSPYKIIFAADALEDIKKAITRADIRGLIAIKQITKSQANQQSRSGARKIAAQKRKGRQKGKGTKRGSKHFVVTKKAKWMSKVRAQRKFLKELRERKLLTPTHYRALYRKSSGGYFRNKRHIKLYMAEQKMIEKK
ncbi:TPA: 50S ribosomal protein L19e [Candidatus Woesearchaeota archaeon]|nr:50S ribosomal protein L19e [Candidatus Woesearchaeota archaeon]